MKLLSLCGCVRLLLAVMAVAAVPTASGIAAEVGKTIGEIERLDPAFDALVPADAKMEIIAEGLDWCEGPLWVSADGGFLIFADIPPNVIYRWDAKSGQSVYLQPAGYTGSAPRGGESGTNGSTLDAAGRLVLCQHGDRRLARMDAPLDKPAATYVTVADKHDGKRFNSPNDAVTHSSGAIYFTDPPYGLEQNMDDPAKELPHQGVYRVTPEGEVTLVTKELERPNGIALSPDEKTLYVANSHGPRPIIMAFPVKEDGSVGEGKVFFHGAELGKTRRGAPDGMEVDEHGNLFATGPGGVLVFSPEGKHLGTFMTGQATSNVAFGEDGETLFITADMYVLRVPLSTKGKGF